MVDLKMERVEARAFLPTLNFRLSIRFYEKLGFEKLLDGDVAIFRIGTSSFILQQHYVKEWAENSMMQLMVDDLDAWWLHINRLDLVSEFGIAFLKAPQMQPWGLRVAYMVDPAGVLWHISERRPGVVQD